MFVRLSPAVHAFLVAVVALSSPAGLRGQGASQPAAPPRVLELRSSSEPAKSLFREALFEQQNVGGAVRTRRAIDSAVTLDPQFALARAYQAFLAAGTGAARAQRVSDVMAAMGAAPVPELLLALFWRESAAGRAASAAPILRSVAELLPGDADFVWQALNTQMAGKSVQEQIAIRKDFVQKFPSHAAPHNTLAYQLAPLDPAAALAEVEAYVRLAPNHPNSHDSYADVLLIQRRTAEALPHVQREIELDPDFPQGHMKLGLIHLMMGDANTARADFARGHDRFPAPATKLDFRHWTVATYAYNADGKNAVRELTGMLTTTLTPGQTAIVHERLAVIEAYLGDRNAVAAHMTAAEVGTPPPPHFALKAIALARINDLTAARSAATQFQSMIPATNLFSHTVNAFIAMQAKDLVTAERELADAPPNDLFTKAIRADLLLRKGQKAEGTALQQEVKASSVKVDGNPPLDFLKLMAKMHADKL